MHFLPILSFHPKETSDLGAESILSQITNIIPSWESPRADTCSQASE